MKPIVKPDLQDFPLDKELQDARENGFTESCSALEKKAFSDENTLNLHRSHKKSVIPCHVWEEKDDAKVATVQADEKERDLEGNYSALH